MTGKPSWGTELQQFTQDTTFHGVRYITDGPHIIRKLLWLLVVLGSTTLVTYMTITNIQKLHSNPKTVNVDVQYWDKLPFPAVTICNQNQIRLTEAYRSGLYDDLLQKYDQQTATGELKGDMYTSVAMCGEQVEQILNMTKWTYYYSGVTTIGCQQLCTRVHDRTCSSLFYNRTGMSCTLLSSTLMRPDNDTTCDSKSDMDWYRRMRNLDSDFQITCGFEEGLCPLTSVNSQDIESETPVKLEQWTVVSASGHTPPLDHTTASAQGGYMQIGRTSNRNNYTSSKRTSFYPFNDMCLEVFYVQTGELAVGFTINRVTEDLNTETIFEVKPGELPEEDFEDTLASSLESTYGSSSGSSYWSGSESSSSYSSSYSSSSYSSSSGSGSGTWERKKRALDDYYISGVEDVTYLYGIPSKKRWKRQTSGSGSSSDSSASSYSSSSSGSSPSSYFSSSSYSSPSSYFSSSSGYASGTGGLQTTFGTGASTEATTNLPEPAPVYEWTRVYRKLPDGIYQLELNSERPDVKQKTTGFVLDDLAIWPCAEFERNCKRFFDGSDFQGKISRTTNGKRCAPWNDVLVDSMSTWATFKPSSASNYCRNLAKDPGGPGCYVKQPQGYYHYSYCTVPFCECSETHFTCDDGQCVSATVTCNGVKECADGSDEGKACTHLQKVDCDFESSYLCGYNVEHESASKWEATDISFVVTSGVTNFLNGQEPKAVLQFQTEKAMAGDRAMATTPQLNTISPSCLGFTLFLYRHSLDTIGRFRVYASTSEIKTLLWEDSGIYCAITECGAWKYHEVALPLGVYHIVFEATHGFQETISILLDDVNVYLGVCETTSSTMADNSTYIIMENPDEKEALNLTGSCAFISSDMCGYTTSSTNSLYGWDFVATDHVSEFVRATTDSNERDNCQFVFWTRRGQFETPNYPGNYNGGVCTYTIKALPGSNITVSFLHFNLEKHSECVYDAMEVIDLKAPPEAQSLSELYCGPQPPFNLTFNSSEITVRFYADYSVHRYGFHAEYFVDPADAEEYAIVTRTEASVSTATIYSSLVSPTLTHTTTQCMTVLLIVKDSLEIKRQMAGGNTEILWHLVYNPRLPLSAKLISVAVSPGTFNLVFESSYLARGGFSSVIYYIDIQEGNCLSPDIIQPPGLSCDYLPSCDYRDVSKTGDRWIANIYEVVNVNETALAELYLNGQLSPNITLNSSSSLLEQIEDWYFNGTLRAANVTTETGVSLPVYLENTFAMSCNDFEKGVVCLLTSPIVNVSEPQCLQFVYYVSSITSQIMLLGMDEDFNQTTNYLGVLQSDFASFDILPVSKWKKAQVDLPSGIYRVGVAATDIAGSGEMRIGATVVTSGNCGFTENVQNLTAIEEPAFTLPNITDTDAPINIVNESTNIGNTTSVNLTTPTKSEAIIPRKSIADQLNMKTFFDRAGHAFEDLVVSWDGKTCDKREFVREHTKLGLCYTFNSGFNGTLQSSRTGAQFGLNMVLNIEQYEHTPGINTDAGVKIHLHSHEDIPTIEETGTAVPLSMHSLVGVTYTKTKSLPLPYSNCSEGTDVLEHYPGKNYTVARCRTLCDMQKATDLCGCKWPYQPGPEQDCQMDMYFSCLIPGLSNATNTCATCSDACTIQAFKTDSSFASLSSLSIQQFLEDKEVTAHVHKRYLESLDIASRANPNTLVNMIKHIQTIIAQLEQLLGQAEEHGTMGELSTFTYSKAALELFLQMVVTDVNGAFSDIDLYEKEYQISLGQRRTGLATALGDAEKAVSHFLDVLDKDRLSLSYSYNELDTLQEHLITTDEWLTLISAEEEVRLKRLSSFFTRLPDSLYSDSKATCATEINNVKGLMSQMENWVYNLYSTVSESEFTQMSQLYYSFTEGSISLQNCLGEYNKVLLGAQNWLANNVFGSNKTQTTWDLTLDFDFNTTQTEVTDAIVRYKKLLGEISTHKISKLDLARVINSTEVARITTLMDTMLSTITKDIQEPLERAITGIQQEVTDTYQQAITYLAYLQKHFHHTTSFSIRARKMKILYEPYVLPDSYLQINFRKKEHLIAETYTTWGKNLDINNFVASNSRTVLRGLVKDYLDEISKNLERTMTEITKTRESVITELLVFQLELQSAATSSNIDASFIQDNFLKLDIYYGELRYESIEQQPAYGILTFFIDLGGSMGLLIGASVLTLFEIFDFIVYTAFRMATTRRVRPKSHEVKVKSFVP